MSMTGLPDNIDEIVSEKDMKRNYEDLIKFVEHSIISCMGTNDPARAMAVGLVANGKEKGDYLLDNYRLLPKPNDLLKKSLRQIFKSREVVRWSAKSGLTFTWEQGCLPAHQPQQAIVVRSALVPLQFRLRRVRRDG